MPFGESFIAQQAPDIVTVNGETSLITEASTLGLPPGDWPREIIIDGMAFGVVRREIEKEQVVGVTYLNLETNKYLFVLND